MRWMRALVCLAIVWLGASCSTYLYRPKSPEAGTIRVAKSLPWVQAVRWSVRDGSGFFDETELEGAVGEAVQALGYGWYVGRDSGRVPDDRTLVLRYVVESYNKGNPLLTALALGTLTIVPWITPADIVVTVYAWRGNRSSGPQLLDRTVVHKARVTRVRAIHPFWPALVGYTGHSVQRALVAEMVMSSMEELEASYPEPLAGEGAR